MTVDERLLGQLIEKVDGVKDVVDGLKVDVRSITSNCPNCTSTLAVHNIQIKALEDNIKAIWNRLWLIIPGVAALAAGVSYGIQRLVG